MPLLGQYKLVFVEKTGEKDASGNETYAPISVFSGSLNSTLTVTDTMAPIKATTSPSLIKKFDQDIAEKVVKVQIGGYYFNGTTLREIKILKEAGENEQGEMTYETIETKHATNYNLNLPEIISTEVTENMETGITEITLTRNFSNYQPGKYKIQLYMDSTATKPVAEGEFAFTEKPFVRRYYHQDHLGSTRMITGEDGEILSTHNYQPFGNEVTESKIEQNNHKFTGHERDMETGLDYMLARHYSSDGNPHFFQVDPGYDYDQMDPMSFNLYGYVRGNPVKLLDPSGMWVDGYSKWYNPTTWFADVGDEDVINHFANADPKSPDTINYFTNTELFPERDNDGSVIVFRPRDTSTVYPTMPFLNDERYNADVYVYNSNGVSGPYLGSTTTTDQTIYPNVQNGLFNAVNHNHTPGWTSW